MIVSCPDFEYERELNSQVPPNQMLTFQAVLNSKIHFKVKTPEKH